MSAKSAPAGRRRIALHCRTSKPTPSSSTTSPPAPASRVARLGSPRACGDGVERFVGAAIEREPRRHLEDRIEARAYIRGQQIRRHYAHRPLAHEPRQRSDRTELVERRGVRLPRTDRGCVRDGLDRHAHDRCRARRSRRRMSAALWLADRAAVVSRLPVRNLVLSFDRLTECGAHRLYAHMTRRAARDVDRRRAASGTESATSAIPAEDSA
jgi:hypothetical protein